MERTSVIGVTAVLVVGSAASAMPLIGAQFRDPSFGGNARIFDVSTTDGSATNARLSGADVISGLAWDGTTLFGLTDGFSNVNGVSAAGGLITIDIETGATTLIGAIGEVDGFLAAEGEIDFDPVTGKLLGASSNNGLTVIFDIDPTTASASNPLTVGGVEDLSAFAFDASGTLWGIDTRFDFSPDRPSSRLVTIDPETGVVLTSVDTGTVLGAVAGMDFHPTTGELFLADGDFGGTNNVYIVDLATGALSLVGETGLPDPFGFSGLSALQFIPSPGAGALLVVGAGMVVRRRRG